MIVHYSGILGKFDYNDKVFKLVCDSDGEHLHFIGKKTSSTTIRIPKGISDCSCMFEGCEQLKTAPVIPNGVTNCSYMFRNCTNLTTAPDIPPSVRKCKGMFVNCRSLVIAPIMNKGATSWSISGSKQPRMNNMQFNAIAKIVIKNCPAPDSMSKLLLQRKYLCTV